MAIPKKAIKRRVTLLVTNAQMLSMKIRAGDLGIPLNAYVTELVMWDRQKKLIEACREGKS